MWTAGQMKANKHVPGQSLSVQSLCCFVPLISVKIKIHNPPLDLHNLLAGMLYISKIQTRKEKKYLGTCEKNDVKF